MLQDVRYLVMTVLSMFNYYEDVLEKFHSPIRTPLQSYLLSCIIKFLRNPFLKTTILSSDFGKLNVEAGTGDTFDRMSGAMIPIPRILTQGPDINMKQMLCEMYFTMLFNKNQDDPTHASFQILSKILEGEESLRHVKETTKLHTGYYEGVSEDLNTLLKTPHKNQFSRSAVIVASKLQSISKFNKANSGVAHTLASQSIYINKYLDEFATFKSSSVCERTDFDPKIYVQNRGDKKDVVDEETKIKVSCEKGQQNRRRRCIEGVKELMDQGYLRSFDLIKNHLRDPFHFQIFKKNQIGGVREILILDIHKRVLVNILESFSRVICMDDDREMLTHGDKKLTLMRDILRHLKRGTGKRAIMNYNFDKTRWAPSFMPIQFLYMFLPFKDIYPSLFRFIAISLINHSNKEFLLPERLIRAWRNDPHNSLQHLMDDNLQQLKELFLKDKKISYPNESNMGQGILHYTSSYYHLCVVSLRDEVYKRLCKKVGISTGEWRDLISSDDSYTAHAVNLDSKQLVKTRIMLFMKSQEVVERVMNVWTSTSKSSISLLIYEFNSMFGSNLTMFPTTFKFALASVHPVNTDSFFRMVKESYISSRQIVENGGSLELYLIANKLNKDYCESIYHTYINGVNNLNNFGLRPEYCPYQLGIYPIMDPGIMIMFGPECHNYNILTKKNNMTFQEDKIFNIMHTLVQTAHPEVYSSMDNIDDVFVGVNRIEARMGPISRLLRIQEAIDMDWEEIQSIIMENPLMLFNPPKNMKELKVKVFMKLYRNGASEALRTTAASIYYGRVAATVSAKAFHIPFVSKENESFTYAECINTLLVANPDPLDISLLYPHMDEFKLIQSLSELEFNYIPRGIFETQNIRHLQLNKVHQRLTNSIVSILNHFWTDGGHDTPNSYYRDWVNLQDILPFIKSSMDETLLEFKGDRDKQVKTLMLIILRMSGNFSKPMKAILFGPSSRSYDNSYMILKQQNMFANATSLEQRGHYMAQSISKTIDKISYAFNYFALSIIQQHPIDVRHMLTEGDIESFLLSNVLSKSSYKKVLIMLLYHGLIEDVTRWSIKTHTIFVKWGERSRIINNKHYGDYQVKIQLSDIILLVDYDYKWDKFSLICNKVSDLNVLNELINKAIELSNLNEIEFISRLNKGAFQKTESTIFLLQTNNGFHISIRSLTSINYHTGELKHENGYFVLYDLENNIIMRAIEGLLHSDYIPADDEIKEDLSLMGISLSRLSKFRPFNTHFMVEHHDPRDMVNLLRVGDEPDAKVDLFVHKPHVSESTNTRLRTDYPVKSKETAFNDIILENEDNNIDALVNTDDFIDLDQEAMMDALLDIDLINEVKAEMDLDSGNFHEVWIDPSFDLELLKTMTKQVITYQPKKILERTLNIKYQILASLIINVNLINRKTIVSIKKYLQNPNFTYSLVYIYDKQFSNTDTPSPNGCEIRIDPEFDRLYGIQGDGDI